MDYNKESLKRHLKFKGKVEIKSKFGKIKTKDDLSISYTPGVAAVSSLLAKNPAESYKYSIKGNTIAVVSDGSAVLGLGNIGPYGALPVMEGKAVPFKEFGGIDAYPIVLSTQDTEEIIKTIKNISPTFGGINLEDISSPRCFEIEERPEIMPDEAKKSGAFIIGTGRSDFSNQINNVLVFPGLFKGLLENKIKIVTDEIKIAVAETIADFLPPSHLKTTKILSSVLDKGVAKAISKKLIKFKK